MDRSNFWCYPDQNILCQVRVTRQVEHRTPSQCFISLISKHKLSQFLNYCDFKQLKRIWDQAILLTDKIIAYINPVPRSIVARCADKQPEHTQLLPYGYINLDPTCTYDIVDGPLSEKDEYISSLTVLNNNQRGIMSLNINNKEAFRTHLHVYAFEYIVTLFVFTCCLVMSIISYVCWLRIRWCQTHKPDTTQESPSPTPSCTIRQNSTPQVDFYQEPYREVRAQLRNLVRQQLALSQI